MRHLIVVVFFSSSTIEVKSGSGNALDQTTSGRTRLASGGMKLARDHPLAGFGSGSFAVEFGKRNPLALREAAVSHTEPITIAAEQGALGIAAYLALLAAAIAVLLTGLRSAAPGLGGSPSTAASSTAASSASRPGAAGTGPSPGGGDVIAISRIAVAAAFAGLFVHTLGYAGFLTDPLTWALLALASALSVRAAAVVPGQQPS